MSAASRFAPAKVNLFLHVGALDPDGYHPLVSLMSFADVGDSVSMALGDPPGLSVEGLFATDLAHEDPAQNLVWRAACKLLDRAGADGASLALRLDKALPVAAGLGGGSSDAGAALTLVRDALGLPVDDQGLAAIASELGADGPACLAARPVLAEGRGDQLSAAPAMPILPAVLVNPRVACPTGPVYRRFDELGARSDAARGVDRPSLAQRFGAVDAVVEALSLCRNDLEPPAIEIAPEIAAVLSLLRDQPQTMLARLSGSGATCFALCAGVAEAEALARGLALARPKWWVRPCRLGGPWMQAGSFTTP